MSKIQKRIYKRQVEGRGTMHPLPHMCRDRRKYDRHDKEWLRDVEFSYDEMERLPEQQRAWG